MMGLIIAFLVAELILSVYNPFGFRQQGDKIVLQPNAKYTLKNNKFAKLDTLIVHTKNSLGFRGPEKPGDFENRLPIITVGGSTTECYYLSDGRDWSALLAEKLKLIHHNIWINNAGFDGHSTFGHSILIRDHIAAIKPGYVVFLVGCNDVGRDDLNEHVHMDYDPKIFGWKSYLRNNSEVVNLLVNLKRNFEARRRGLVHTPFEVSACEILDSLDTAKIQAMLDFHKNNYLTNYESRLKNLINLTKANNIIPVLVTQPALVGEGMDDVTKVDLEKVMACNHLGGKTHWLILETYNDVTRKVAEAQGVLLIDLARKMPKSSRYFYDCEHFTNEGSEIVAQILYDDLKDYVKHGHQAGK